MIGNNTDAISALRHSRHSRSEATARPRPRELDPGERNRISSDNYIAQTTKEQGSFDGGEDTSIIDESHASKEGSSTLSKEEEQEVVVNGKRDEPSVPSGKMLPSSVTSQDGETVSNGIPRYAKGLVGSACAMLLLAAVVLFKRRRSSARKSVYNHQKFVNNSTEDDDFISRVSRTDKSGNSVSIEQPFDDSNANNGTGHCGEDDMSVNSTIDFFCTCGTSDIQDL